MDLNVFKQKPQLLIEQFTGKHLMYNADVSPLVQDAPPRDSTAKSRGNNEYALKRTILPFGRGGKVTMGGKLL